MNLKVIVYRRPNFLDPNFEMENYMGMSHLKYMFVDMEIHPEVKSLFFSFPERWLNIIQQRALIDRIQHYFPNCNDVHIKTHSVYIIQTVSSKDIGILDLPHIEETSDVNAVLYNDMVDSVFDLDAGINVLGGDVQCS